MSSLLIGMACKSAHPEGGDTAQWWCLVRATARYPARCVWFLTRGFWVFAAQWWFRVN